MMKHSVTPTQIHNVSSKEEKIFLWKKDRCKREKYNGLYISVVEKWERPRDSNECACHKKSLISDSKILNNKRSLWKIIEINIKLKYGMT